MWLFLGCKLLEAGIGKCSVCVRATLYLQACCSHKALQIMAAHLGDAEGREERKKKGEPGTYTVAALKQGQPDGKCPERCWIRRPGNERRDQAGEPPVSRGTLQMGRPGAAQPRCVSLGQGLTAAPGLPPILTSCCAAASWGFVAAHPPPAHFAHSLALFD